MIVPEKGSFGYYLSLGEKSKFFEFLTIAIMSSDYNNKEKLRNIYPYIILASERDLWETAPEIDFELVKNIDEEKNYDFKTIKPRSKNDFKSGCFFRYIYYSGSFVTNIARAILYADANNFKLIGSEYPQMVAAFLNDWNTPPEGFVGDWYNSSRKRKIK